MMKIFEKVSRILVSVGRRNPVRSGTVMFGVVAGFIGAGSMLSNIVYIPIGTADKDQLGRC